MLNFDKGTRQEMETTQTGVFSMLYCEEKICYVGRAIFDDWYRYLKE
jgi:hypothetical protein